MNAARVDTDERAIALSVIMLRCALQVSLVFMHYWMNVLEASSKPTSPNFLSTVAISYRFIRFH
ncbi:MAG: hypothetical protein AAFY26_11335 [Cyanobacteria bacterium J06638_22]